MNKKLLNRRVWLRPASSWGPESSIHSHVTVDSHKYTPKDRPERTSTSIDGSFSIRDCSHTISLDLYADKKKNSLKHLAALDKLVEEILLVREAYTKAMQLAEEHWK